MEWRLGREAAGFADVSEGRYPLLPVSEDDVRRGAAKIPGLHFERWSQKTDGDDEVYQYRLKFDNTDALAAFLGSQYGGAEITEDGGKHRMSVSLGQPREHTDADLDALIEKVFDGYRFEMRFSFASNCTASVDGALSSSKTVSLEVEGKSVVFEGAMSEVLTAREGSWLRVLW
jgi:hypothetical protein